MKQQFLKDKDNMEEIVLRTADRADIWQDRFVYWMAVTLIHILDWIIRKENKIEKS